MESQEAGVGKTRRIAGTVLFALGSFALVGSSVTKFAHVPKVVQELGQLGFSNERLMIIAVLEIVSAIVFIVPLTRDIGLLLISSYLGGAIAAHMGHGESVLPPAIILAFFWVGTFLRHPQAMWSHTALFESARRRRDVRVSHVPQS